MENSYLCHWNPNHCSLKLRVAGQTSTKMDEKKPRNTFAGAKQPSMKRRSNLNNYYGKHIYMLTLVVEGRRPVLGELVVGTENGTKGNGAYIKLTPLGEAVTRCWKAIPLYHPEVKLLAFQMMPDHLHGVLFVQEETETHLGQVVSGFIAGCNKAYRELFGNRGDRPLEAGIAEAVPQPTQSLHSQEQGKEGAGLGNEGLPYEAAPPLPFPSSSPLPFSSSSPLPLPSEQRLKADDRKCGLLFERGYNDLIAKGYDMLPRLIGYVKDNPRRLAIRRAHKDLFRVHFGVQFGNHVFAAIGNQFLLEYPEKEQVQLSRRFSESEIAESVDYYLAKAAQGAVLVSPAISRGEKAVMRAALNARRPIIFITSWGFNEFSKPGHQYFEACAEGRLLLLAPWPHQNERMALSRAMCMELNSMTEAVCNYNPFAEKT